MLRQLPERLAGYRISCTTMNEVGPYCPLMGPVTTPSVMKFTNLPTRHDVAPLPESHSLVLFPVVYEPCGSEHPGTSLEFIIEPNPEAILNTLLPRYVEVQIYQTLLETVASEQSARLVAMRSATDNAMELIQELTLTYNKARQAAITKEIAEISGAAEALAKAS